MNKIIDIHNQLNQYDFIKNNRYKKQKMNKYLSIIISLLSINLLFGSINTNNKNPENSIPSISIREISGEEMPGWEKQILELYANEEGETVPLIFRGAAKNWPAANWTPEKFAEKFPDSEILALPPRVLEESIDYNEDGKLIALRNIPTTIKDHIKDITCNSKNSLYLFGDIYDNMTLKEIQEELEFLKKPRHNKISENPDQEVTLEDSEQDEDLLLNSLFIKTHLDLVSNTHFPQPAPKGNLHDDDEGRSYFFFLGGANTIASLHSHGSTFLAQIYGKKLATLINPKYQEKCACTLQDDGKFVSRCAVDILNPDFEKYPELQDIEIYQTILEPGDILYIPDGWLHDIRALTPSISIAHGF